MNHSKLMSLNSKDKLCFGRLLPLAILHLMRLLPFKQLKPLSDLLVHRSLVLALTTVPAKLRLRVLAVRSPAAETC